MSASYFFVYAIYLNLKGYSCKINVYREEYHREKSGKVKAPLYNKLLAYSSSKLSFHMPGHKFGTAADISHINLALLDNTEVVEMDNLYEAKGVIKQAMDLMAEFYGAKHTLFLTNGSTAGILASILAVCRENEKIIVARNCHHSVWSALILSGAVPVYVNPVYLKEEDLLGEISAEEIERAIKEHPDAKGVILVSPTYEGIVSDINAIAHIVHKYNKILIVDEAHGAHFVVGEPFPVNSIEQGADIIINSMHKTLPTLTQSALLHIGSDKIEYNELLRALKMVQTSSPSYIMMGMMDYIRAYILENKDLIKKDYIENLMEMRAALRQLKYLRLIDIKDSDISKIIISTISCNIEGYKLAELLDKKYNIVVEAAFKHYIIIITTIADNKKTLSLLKKAVFDIDDHLTSSISVYEGDYLKDTVIKNAISPKVVYYALKEWIDLKDSEGQVAAHHIMLYPPGIPIICMGETISRWHINHFYELKDKLEGINQVDNKLMIQVIKQTKISL
jgi:arginine/lysine/ornithine decarboxylase